MILFDQQTFSDHSKGEYGDCTRAVVYTLLQEDIDLPHPIDSSTGGWNMAFFDDLEEKTGKHLTFYGGKIRDNWPDLVGRSGISERGIRHLIVWSTILDVIVHDPHPSRSGLVTYDGWFVLQ